jgi:hypothetical protein
MGPEWVPLGFLIPISHARRSSPAGTRSQMARRRVTRAAGRIAFSSMPPAWCRSQRASRRISGVIVYKFNPRPSAPTLRRRVPRWPARAGRRVMQPTRLPTYPSLCWRTSAHPGTPGCRDVSLVELCSHMLGRDRPAVLSRLPKCPLIVPAVSLRTLHGSRTCACRGTVFKSPYCSRSQAR